jgi:hypothetical protein
MYKVMFWLQTTVPNLKIANTFTTFCQKYPEIITLTLDLWLVSSGQLRSKGWSAEKLEILLDESPQVSIFKISFGKIYERNCDLQLCKYWYRWLFGAIEYKNWVQISQLVVSGRNFADNLKIYPNNFLPKLINKIDPRFGACRCVRSLRRIRCQYYKSVHDAMDR